VKSPGWQRSVSNRLASAYVPYSFFGKGNEYFKTISEKGGTETGAGFNIDIRAAQE
jgi:hypothetical protein